VTQDQAGGFGKVTAFQLGEANGTTQIQKPGSSHDNALAVQVGARNTSSQTQR